MACVFLLSRRRSLHTKAILVGVAAGIAGAVASTRVLLGVHWFTDVLAGLALGWAWFAIGSIAFGGPLLRFGAPVAQAEAVGGSGDRNRGRAKGRGQTHPPGWLGLTSGGPG